MSSHMLFKLAALALASLVVASLEPVEERAADGTSVSCVPYIPRDFAINQAPYGRDFTTDQARINFEEASYLYPEESTCVSDLRNLPSGKYTSAPLPFNATTSKKKKTNAFHGFVLDSAVPGGAIYNLSACNVTTLKLTSPQYDGYAASDFETRTVYNFIRIERTVGRVTTCLTTKNRAKNTSDLKFEPCQTHPKTRSQFFLAQHIEYYEFLNPCGPNCNTLYPCTGTWIENLRDDGQIPYHRKDAPAPPKGAYYMWNISPKDNRTVEVIHYDTYTNWLLAIFVDPYYVPPPPCCPD